MSLDQQFLYAIGGDIGYTIERYSFKNSNWEILDITIPDHYSGI